MTRREKLQEMLTSTPDDPFLHYGLAMECRNAGERDAALAELRTVLRLDPNYVAAYFHQGQMLAEGGDVAAAQHILQSGIAVADRVGDPHAAEEMRGLLATL